MCKYSWLMFTALICGCGECHDTNSAKNDSPRTTSQHSAAHSDAIEEQPVDELRARLTKRGWSYTSGGFGAADSWSFHFLVDGTYTFTLYSDFQSEPIPGKWSLIELPDGDVSLRLRDLERGKYYIIDQESYPRYDAKTDTMMFPSQLHGRGYSFRPWKIKEGG